MAINDILLIICLLLIVVWTARIAYSKGLNPWVWGAGALLLMAVALSFNRQFLGPVALAPLLILLLYRSPWFRKDKTRQAVPCSRCAAPDSGGLNFCVHCGWDLKQQYSETSTEEPLSPATAKPPVVKEAAAPVFESALEVGPEINAQAEPESGESLPEPVEAALPIAPQPVAEPDGIEAEPVSASEVDQPPSPRMEPAPEESHRRPVRRILTAASMTEQGIALFSQGKFQEAVDQFTKAIALDPKYRLAWERRAEAYGRLGRLEQEAEDKRQLEAI